MRAASSLVTYYPWILVGQFCLLAAAYGLVGDWKKALYWTGAAIINTAVTVM